MESVNIVPSGWNNRGRAYRWELQGKKKRKKNGGDSKNVKKKKIVPADQNKAEGESEDGACQPEGSQICAKLEKLVACPSG